MAIKFDPVQHFDKAPDAMVLRPAQCCDVLNCSIPTYYRWAKQGRLKLVKVGPGVFVYNGVVAPGQTIQLSVSAVPKKKNRRKRRLINLARRNSNAVASADNAGSKPVLFRITEVNGRRKRKGGHFSS